ncbi:MAG: hypothetical protein IPM53_33450 [Anaerolineaceae bacterium]|nr:hypothetical protein [Anaerolineaceae bacterium]
MPPIYDQSDLPGFYLAVGTSGNQFKNAAGAGHLMAGLIDAVEKGQHHDVDPISPETRSFRGNTTTNKLRKTRLVAKFVNQSAIIPETRGFRDTS